MMRISLQNTGKRYNREWIFRNITHEFLPGSSTAITGSNGSGKSTLLQIIAGAALKSEGQVKYFCNSSLEKEIAEPYHALSIAAPYLELIEEMTALEFLNFHNRFKRLTHSLNEILLISGLQSASHKQIRYFSSGMKQRLKLAQAFFSDTKLLLLDEPTTNLDAEGCELYHLMVNKFSNGRTLIISSNDKEEYIFCKEEIKIGDFKSN